MDIFQLIGDFLHLFAVLILLLKILASKNVIGVSYKTQEMYLIVFMTRYSDMILENHWGSIYFNIMRIFFIFITAYTIRIIRFKRPFKLVLNILKDRVMTNKLMRFHIIGFTYWRSYWVFWCIQSLQFMVYFGLFQFGFRLWRYCLSCTWSRRTRTLKTLLLIMCCS